MSHEAPALSFLEELDARQNELLDELDRLNSRIEQVIAEWGSSGEHDDAAKVPKAA
jgi:uncharacterized protein YdcH (DUF465 family)